MTPIQEKYLRSLEDFFATGLAIVEGKMQDYSADSDPFENFRFAALAAGVRIEQVFLMLDAIKLARLRTLIVGNKTPNNESVKDTLSDKSNYTGIFATYLDWKTSTDPDYLYAGEPEPSDAEVPSEEPVLEVTPEPTPEELTPVQKLLNFFTTRND